MLIGKREIAKLIPHAGDMCLLDAVVDWDEMKIRCRSLSHLSADNPLRSHGRLGAICAVEYASQAMAVHGALAGVVARKPQRGYLASLRDLALDVDSIDHLAGDLIVDAQRLMGDELRVIYQFTVRVGETKVCQGRATVVLDLPASFA